MWQRERAGGWGVRGHAARARSGVSCRERSYSSWKFTARGKVQLREPIEARDEVQLHSSARRLRLSYVTAAGGSSGNQL